MSSVDEVIRIGEFRLSAFERIVRLQLDVAKTRVEIAEKLQDVLAKHIENRRAEFRLKELKNAKRRFLSRLKKAKRELTKAESKLAIFDGVQTRVASLAMGELITVDEVRRSWGALKRAVRLCANYGVILKSPKASAKDRKGKHFIKPADKAKKIKDAPDDKEVILVLFLEWAAPRTIVPRLNSPPYAKLVKLVGAINEAFSDIAQPLEEELEKVAARFDKLAEKNWQEINPIKEAKKKD